MMEEFWMPLIGWPLSLMNWLTLAAICLLFAVMQKPVKNHHAALLALGVTLAVFAAIPNISENGLFAFENFTIHLMEMQLGHIILLYVLAFLGIYLTRAVVKKMLPKKFFSKN